VDHTIAEMYPTELSSLQIDPAWHRKGLGRKLVGKMAKLFLDKGSSNLLVRVLADNPNLPFYRKLGAERVGEQDFDWEGYRTKEIILVWKDLQKLTCCNESSQ
jgi:GNAT superfamily N-acetyltransferase